MANRLAEKLVLVGWDGADWRVIQPLLDEDKMPNLRRLIDEGVMGNLQTVQPQCTSLLWACLATGKRADKHGVLDDLEVADDATRPTFSGDWKSRSLWDVLSQNGIAAQVVGWPATHPARPILGAWVSELFAGTTAEDRDLRTVLSNAIHPSNLVEPLAEFRVAPQELTYAHLLPFVPAAAEVDQTRDTRVAFLATVLAEAASVHAAATWLLEQQPWEFAAVYYDLIDRLSHQFMPYHPPRHADVPLADYEHYQHVVTAAYRYCDMMLGRVIELAGPAATIIVVSDHGFHCGRLRPRDYRERWRKATNWHREQGIFVMRGPGALRDELIWQASLLDVTPTVLSLYGLPVGEDMDGRLLAQCFESIEPPERISTPENGDRPADLAGDSSWLEPLDVREGLGRLQREDKLPRHYPREISVTEAVARRRRYHLALSQMNAGRGSEAAVILQSLNEEDSDNDNYAFQLARCYCSTGRTGEARPLLERAMRRGGFRDCANMLLAVVRASEGDHQEALRRLFEAEQSNPDSPEVHCHIGDVYLRLNQIEQAKRAFERALENDPDSASAYRGLARVFLKLGRLQPAAEAALNAVGLVHHSPLGHYHLGVALANLGEIDAATGAFQTCLAQDPEFAPARHWLKKIQN